MRKKKILLIFIILLLLIAIGLIVINYNQKLKIDNTKDIWIVYDENIKNIKNNMNEITVPNENFYWWELKDFNIQDEHYKQTLNLLVADIRMCYLALTDDGTRYTGSNSIIKYRNKNTITTQELERLRYDMNHKWCLDYFNRYFNMTLSNDSETETKVFEKVNSIIFLKQSDLFQKQNPTYNELVSRKIIETTILSNLSSWIKSEYYKLK
jgi:hypothetical protein